MESGREEAKTWSAMADTIRNMGELNVSFVAVGGGMAMLSQLHV